MVCDDYQLAGRLASIMLAHGKRSGATINLAKSEGISLLAGPGRTELRTKPSFTFLGHDISPAGISISRKTITRFKKRISSILYKHLLRHPKRGEFNPNRLDLTGVDWDLVTCVNELRRYLYGRLGEAYLRRALVGARPLRLSNCALSYFPLVTNPREFERLDGWLADVLARTYEKRRTLLSQLGYSTNPISKRALRTGEWYNASLRLEPNLPCVVSAWRYVRKCYHAYGLKHFPAPPPYSS